MRNARTRKNHSNPVTWRPEPQSQNAAYARVVHGRRKKPRSGMIQLSKARLRTSLKIHSRKRTSRGEMSARSASRQPMHRVSHRLWTVRSLRSLVKRGSSPTHDRPIVDL
jgi:hypothetical protein